MTLVNIQGKLFVHSMAKVFRSLEMNGNVYVYILSEFNTLIVSVIINYRYIET